MALASAMIAGPATSVPAGIRSRSNSGTSRHPPADHRRTVSGRASGIVSSILAMPVRSGCGVSPVASTETASTMSGRSRRKEYVVR